MKWYSKELDADLDIVKNIVTAIRRIRSINNFNKNQSESNTDKYFKYK